MSLISDEQYASKKYELDTEEIEYNGEKVRILKLTKDNVARMEAIIKIDSNYKDSNDINKKILYDKNNKIKYNGSSSYWLNQLKEIIYSNKSISSFGYKYEEIIFHIIVAIDNENSTHLNSDKIGREAVKKRILNIDKDKLIGYLKNPRKEYELIDIIQNPEDVDEKNHLSFATKFCHYLSLFLFKDEDAGDNFSIYDSILKKTLPKYIKRYLNKDVKEKDYENDYRKYINYIDDIRESASSIYGEKISRNGFDHLLWYYHKGRK